MSHITRISLSIGDLDALEAAAPTIGLELRRNQRTHKTYGGATGKCIHALVLKGDPSAYEIGLVQSVAGSDAAYDLNVDLWNQTRLSEAVGGANFNRLRREYAATVAEKEMTAVLARKGFQISRERLANGRIRIAARSRR